MTKLIINEIDSRTASTEFKDVITANHSKQWLDTYGVIKAFKILLMKMLQYLQEQMVSVLEQQKYLQDILSPLKVSGGSYDK